MIYKILREMFDEIVVKNKKKKKIDTTIENILESINKICNTEILISEIDQYVKKINNSDNLRIKQIKIEKLMNENKIISNIDKDNVVDFVEKYIIKSVLWDKSHTININNDNYISLNIVITLMFNSMIKRDSEENVTKFIKTCFSNKIIESRIISIRNIYKKRQLYILCNYDIDEMNFNFSVKPMIYMPKNWKINYGKKKEVNIEDGGLICIKKKLIAGDENNSISCYHQFNKIYLNYINKSQEVSVKYNIELLSEVLNIIKENEYKIIPFNRDTNNIKIKEIHKKYVNKIIKENNIKDKVWINNIKNYNKNMIKKIINKDTSNIRNYINNLSLIIILIKIQGKSIIECYYKMKICHRLRESTDGSLSYIYTKFLRPFTFVNNIEKINEIGDKYFRYCITSKVKKINSIKDTMTWNEIMNVNIDDCKDKFDFISFRHIYKKKEKNIMINLDACQSMLQIYGCIISNEKILNICNAINKKEIIIDAYDYILKISDYNDINDYYVKYILTYIINKRSIKKKIIMEYLYGSTPSEIAKKIIKEERWINHRHILIAINIIVKKKLKVIFKDIIIMNDFLKTYVDACSNEYYRKIKDKNKDEKNNKEINKIINYLKENELLDKIIFKDWDGNKIIYCERDVKKKNILIKKSLIQINISRKDMIKRSAISPNLIHFIDSLIVREVKKYFIKKNISVLTIYDCFFIHPNKSEELINIYNKCLKKISEIKRIDEIMYIDEYIIMNYINNKGKKSNKLKEKYERLNEITNVKLKAKFDNIYSLKP